MLGLIGDQLCLRRVLLKSGLTLRGVEVTWLCSSAKPTLVPWWIGLKFSLIVQTFYFMSNMVISLMHYTCLF